MGLLLSVFVRGNLDVLRALRESQSRALLFPATSYALYGVLAGLYCRIKGWPSYLYFHNLEPEYRRLLRWLSLLITAFFHCTKWARERTLRTNPYLRGKQQSIIFNRTAIGSGTSHEIETRTEAGRLRLVYIGQLAEHKGLDLMIEAFLLLADAHRDVDLHIVGEGDPDYVDSLHRLIGALGGRVVFRGYLDDIEPVLSGALALLFPTPPSRYHESFGNVATEAMALGVPAVTFASGAVPSIVVDGETGFVVKSEDPAQYATAIECLLQDPQLRSRMGERARKRFENHFGDAMIRQQWFQALGLV